MAKCTRYHICYSQLGWNDPYALTCAKPEPGTRNHRTLRAAARAESLMQTQVERATGMALNTRILALVNDGNDYRYLTEDEHDEVMDAFDD